MKYIDKLPDNIYIEISLHQYGSRLTDKHEFESIQEVLAYLEKQQIALTNNEGVE